MKYLVILLFISTSYSQLLLKEVIEDPSWYLPKLKSSHREFIIKKNDYIEITAVGDSAWTYGARPSDGSKIPKEANFDTLLNKLDPNKDIFVGDISFVNWESGVGEFCDNIRPTVSFYFLSHPQSVQQAIDHGFNLIGMANNHSQDCNSGRAFKNSSEVLHGPLMSKESLEALSGDFLWHGVGEDSNKIKMKKFSVKGKEISIAFASLSLISWDIPNSSFINFRKGSFQDKINSFLKGFDIKADYKILALHTQDKSGHEKPEAEAFLLMKKIGEIFINKYDGDLVLGQGAHTFGGVKVFEKKNKKSVFVTSLGNFIHDGLRSNPDNYIAKVLLNKTDLSLAQIQIIPFINNLDENRIRFYNSQCSRKEKLVGNFEFKKAESEMCLLYYSP